jgi:ASCH domain
MAVGGNDSWLTLESFSFGDCPAAADECLELVRIGRKTATCWAASEGEKGAEVGKRWIVKDGQGRPGAIVETVELTRRRFEEADEALAYDGARATDRSNIGGSCIRTISPGKARFRRTWSSIANGSGSLKSSTATDGCGDCRVASLLAMTAHHLAVIASVSEAIHGHCRRPSIDDCLTRGLGPGSSQSRAPLSML